MRLNLIIWFVFGLLILSCNNKKNIKSPDTSLSHQQSIKISAAYALSPLVKTWTEEFSEVHPDIQFNLQTIGSGYGIPEVLAEKVDFAMISSLPPSDLDSALWFVPVAKLFVVPVVNSQNPYLAKLKKTGLKRDDLVTLFSGKSTVNWGDLLGNGNKDKIEAFIRSDEAGSTEVLARYLWLEPGEIKGTGVNGEIEMLSAIKDDIHSIGYINFVYTYNFEKKTFNEDITIIPLDLNQNGELDNNEDFYFDYATLQRAMWLGKYPCLLNRELFIISKGKPSTMETVEFLKWILTEGQKCVSDEGYIELHSHVIRCGLNCLKN